MTKQIRKTLMDNKIAYRSKKLHSKYLLVHRRNRGGLLVNAFNSHRNGAKIASFGGDRAELHSAVCIELNPDPEKRNDCLFLLLYLNKNRENIVFIFETKTQAKT